MNAAYLAETYQTPIFMVLDDEQAVQLQHITSMRALNDQDIDLRTGEYPAGVPKGARSRVDTIRGYFYTATPFDELIERLSLVSRALAGDDRG